MNRRTMIRAALGALGLGSAAMLSADDDLSGLFDPPSTSSGPAIPLGYRQGVLTAWNPLTLENSVRIDRTEYQNLPILGFSEVATYAAGVQVGVVLAGSTWAIIGRWVRPDPAGATPANAITTYYAEVNTLESTASGAFTDLATPGPGIPGVLVGRSGRCLVTLSADIICVAVTGQAIATGAGSMSFNISGATVQGETNARTLRSWIRYNAAPNSTMAIDTQIAASKTVMVTGLNPGLHDFRATYRADGGTPQFQFRTMTVVTL